LVVPDARVEEAIKTLADTARHRKDRRWKDLVYEVAEAIRIRNGDRGESAL
jgi:nitrogen regulatory protein P-II 1